MTTQRLKQVLLAGGWYSGRQIDVTTLVDAVERCGFVASPYARQFLAEFGGLELRYGSGHLMLHTHVDEIDREYYVELLPAIQRFASPSICLVGVTDSGGVYIDDRNQRFKILNPAVVGWRYVPVSGPFEKPPYAFLDALLFVPIHASNPEWEEFEIDYDFDNPG